MIFSSSLSALAEMVLSSAKGRHLRLATAESCTGGLIAGLLTEIPGSSDVIDRGFVTYSNEAKEEMLSVPHALLAAHGAVSPEVAIAMAEGAVRHSRAEAAVAVTGIAGPGGGTAEKPVGLVHIAACCRGPAVGQEHRFGAIGRSAIRLKTVQMALALLLEQITAAQ